MSKIVIGIQARSTSTRLPGKSLATIAGKPMIEYILKSARKACIYIRENMPDNCARVVVLTPRGDPLVKYLGSYWDVIEGSESDVLSRYKQAVDEFSPDYVVRLTADCWNIPPFIISKHTEIACVNQYDYCSNVDERWRTARDGHDTEIMSARMINWANDIASMPEDREHVTTLIRRSPPDWAKMGTIIGHKDESHIKESIDTEEELARARGHLESLNRKLALAMNIYGPDQIHRV